MKKQALIETIIGAIGIIVLLLLRNEWAYIPLICFGIGAVVLIRRIYYTEQERQWAKKRNLGAVVLLVASVAICYFATSDFLASNSLWLLLAIYIFLTGHGLLLLNPKEKQDK